MDVHFNARVYNGSGGPQLVRFTMHVPVGDELGLDYMSPQQLDEMLNASLLDDVQAPLVPQMPEAELNCHAKRERYRTCYGATGSTCAVCLEDFRPRMYVRSLPCGHRFCSKCITKWVSGHTATCPTCRTPVVQ